MAMSAFWPDPTRHRHWIGERLTTEQAVRLKHQDRIKMIEARERDHKLIFQRGQRMRQPGGHGQSQPPLARRELARHGRALLPSIVGASPILDAKANDREAHTTSRPLRGEMRFSNALSLHDRSDKQILVMMDILGLRLQLQHHILSESKSPLRAAVRPNG